MEQPSLSASQILEIQYVSELAEVTLNQFVWKMLRKYHKVVPRGVSIEPFLNDSDTMIFQILKQQNDAARGWFMREFAKKWPTSP